ncbi:predicted protein [Meyerozyma guilliermondii ATCC 6260]|uniref:Uncharacterized protein n=1 Tax=Meyerozyma guilliermondii (strain ATCC 6260 / CBS 566 / DSM 6381 / JCM 1539 / NBRC 10279 / NRRL Y-324) TaxID=294746 RepID=A5D9V9_PICGU|nr:uncharacterized protein PGUG_00064 [Meyerozyma guilliermondii ATCC 6260]EDK35966.2 predicted protein [Meyerozyma guilliermondii ATCC 6260]
MGSEKSYKKTLEKVPFNSQLELIDQALENYSRTQAASYTNGNGNKNIGYSYSHHNNTQQQHAQHKYTLAAVAAAAAVQHQQQQSFIFQQQQSQQLQQHQHQNKPHHLINNALNSQQQPSLYRQPQQHQSGDFHSRSYYNSDPAMNTSFHDIQAYQKPYDFRSGMMSVNDSSNSVTNSPLSMDLMKSTSFTSGENSISPIVLQPQNSANSVRSSPPAMPLSTNSPAPTSQFLSSGMSTHNQWSAGRQSIWGPNGNSATISSSQPESFGKIW